MCRSPRSPGGSRSTTCALHRSPSALTRRLLLPSPQSHRPRKAALRFGKHHETPPNKPGNTGGKEHKRETFRRGSYAAFPLLAVPCAARRAAALFRRRRGHAAGVRQNARTHSFVRPSIFDARFFLHKVLGIMAPFNDAVLSTQLSSLTTRTGSFGSHEAPDIFVLLLI